MDPWVELVGDVGDDCEFGWRFGPYGSRLAAVAYPVELPAGVREFFERCVPFPVAVFRASLSKVQVDCFPVFAEQCVSYRVCGEPWGGAPFFEVVEDGFCFVEFAAPADHWPLFAYSAAPVSGSCFAVG